MKKYFYIAFLPSLAYAILRYNIFKEVPWKNLPLWVTNKAFALTALILIGYSFCAPRTKPKKEIGLLGFFVALIHVILSLILLSPAYYEKFYEADGKMVLIGEIAILVGVLSFAFLFLAAYQSFPRLRDKTECNLRLIHQLVLGSLLLNLVHVFVMGYKGWINMSSWPGMIPPITLVSFILCVLFLGRRYLMKYNRKIDANGK